LTHNIILNENKKLNPCIRIFPLLEGNNDEIGLVGGPGTNTISSLPSSLRIVFFKGKKRAKYSIGYCV